MNISQTPPQIDFPYKPSLPPSQEHVWPKVTNRDQKSDGKGPYMGYKLLMLPLVSLSTEVPNGKYQQLEV